MSEQPKLYDKLQTCPLTGLPLNGRAKFLPYQGNSKQVLYEFKPIGSAVFEFDQMMAYWHSMEAGNHKPNIDLAGRCREAAEKGQAPLLITAQLLQETQEAAPKTFKEKKEHFLRLLYEIGGSEYIERELVIDNDFPLAFAKDREEFSRIIKTLAQKRFITYHGLHESDNDHPFGLRPRYYGVLLTSEGEEKVDQLNATAIALEKTKKEDEIIRNEARTAFGKIDGHTFMRGIEPFMEKVRQQLARFHTLSSKEVFLDETLNQVQAALDRHRVKCVKGPDCPTDKLILSAQFFVQEEVKVLVKLAPAGIKDSSLLKQPVMAEATSTTIQKVFISHASADRKIVDELVELLELIGIPSDQIFYTSLPEYGITPGQDFLERIRTEISAQVLVLFAMSAQFINSPVCLCEMGAAWVLSRTHIPIVIPPFSFSDIRGVVPLTQGVILTDAAQINTFAKTVAKAFGLPSPLQQTTWERKRNRILDRINTTIAATAEEAKAAAAVEEAIKTADAMEEAARKVTKQRRSGGGTFAI